MCFSDWVTQIILIIGHLESLRTEKRSWGYKEKKTSETRIFIYFYYMMLYVASLDTQGEWSCAWFIQYNN